MIIHTPHKTKVPKYLRGQVTMLKAIWLSASNSFTNIIDETNNILN